MPCSPLMPVSRSGILFYGVRDSASGHRRPPLASLAPHQPRPARDAAHALERRGVAASQGRVQEGSRAEESDPARGVVQLIVTDAPADIVGRSATEEST